MMMPSSLLTVTSSWIFRRKAASCCPRLDGSSSLSNRLTCSWIMFTATSTLPAVWNIGKYTYFMRAPHRQPIRGEKIPENKRRKELEVTWYCHGIVLSKTLRICTAEAILQMWINSFTNAYWIVTMGSASGTVGAQTLEAPTGGGTYGWQGICAHYSSEENHWGGGGGGAGVNQNETWKKCRPKTKTEILEKKNKEDKTSVPLVCPFFYLVWVSYPSPHHKLPTN